MEVGWPNPWVMAATSSVASNANRPNSSARAPLLPAQRGERLRGVTAMTGKQISHRGFDSRHFAPGHLAAGGQQFLDWLRAVLGLVRHAVATAMRSTAPIWQANRANSKS